MYICAFCGTEYTDEQAHYNRYMCRKCVEPLDEAHECEVCGSYHTEDELIGGVCEECLDKCREDIDVCYEIGMEHRENVKINSFLLSLFDGADIEAILIDIVRKNKEDYDCSAFVDNDISWFAEQLVKQEYHT